MTMSYKSLDPISREEYFTVFRNGSGQQASGALLRLAWHEQEARWAERQCAAALKDHRSEVRAAAATALGHLARRQKGLETATIIRLTDLRTDPQLGSRIQDALDDLAVFGRDVPAS